MPVCPRCNKVISQRDGDCPHCAASVDGSDEIRRTVRESAPRTTMAEPALNAPTPRQTIQEPIPAGRQTLVEPAGRQTLVEPAARQTLIEPGSIAPQNAMNDARPISPAALFRPHRRPPMALLTAFDDGRRESGETWRLRDDCFVMGRVEGNIVIPHDPDISGRHAEILRRWQDDSYVWHLVDLKSTNGTFLRVKRAVLRNRRELLLGKRRYEFRAPDVAAPGLPRLPPQTVPDAISRSTLEAVSPPDSDDHPRLIELCSGAEPGATYYLPPEADSATIGRDSNGCDVVIDDPFLGGREARLYRDDQGRWAIEAVESLNGIWIRVERTTLESPAQFQIGEQRFRFEVL